MSFDIGNQDSKIWHDRPVDGIGTIPF